MSLDMLIAWVRQQGPRMTSLLVLGLLADWSCVRLGALARQRLASSSADSLAAERWAALFDSSLRLLGHLFLLAVGAIVVLDIFGLGLQVGALWGRLSSAVAQVAIVALLALFAARVVNLVAQYAEGTVLRGRRGDGDLGQRARTVGGVARNFGLALIAVIATLMILAALGLNTAPLLASAGVIGVAIGFGAQTLVRDVLSGLFILIEDQFAVGDTVDIMGATGQVERMSLRATIVRGYDGTLHTIPNGEIRRVANQSRDWSRAIVDVGIGYHVSLQRALDVLDQAIHQAASDPTMAPLLLGEPKVLGVQELGAELIVLRAVLLTKPGQQALVRREASRLVLEALDRAGMALR